MVIRRTRRGTLSGKINRMNLFILDLIGTKIKIQKLAQNLLISWIEKKKCVLKVRLTQMIKLKTSLLKWYKGISNLVINLVTYQESKSFVVVMKNANDWRIGNRIVTKEGLTCISAKRTKWKSGGYNSRNLNKECKK